VGWRHGDANRSAAGASARKQIMAAAKSAEETLRNRYRVRRPVTGAYDEIWLTSRWLPV